MPVLQTLIAPQSREYQENAKAMAALVEDLQKKVAHIAQGGGVVAVAKHKARGKMVACERIDHLIDPGSDLATVC